MKGELREAIKQRSSGRCEADVWTEVMGWQRCSATATDIHHLLPKSRGGGILDEVGETYHLIHLCRMDHAQAHSRQDADGMMIDGSVTWNKLTQQPEYQGTDPYLSQRYTTTDG